MVHEKSYSQKSRGTVPLNFKIYIWGNLSPLPAVVPKFRLTKESLSSPPHRYQFIVIYMFSIFPLFYIL